MPYDTHNRWVHGVLAEAAKTLPDLPWSRRAKHARRSTASSGFHLAPSPATGIIDFNE